MRKALDEAYRLGREAGIELAALKATEWYLKRGDALDIARSIRELVGKLDDAQQVAHEPARNSCNLHDDCKAADEAVMKINKEPSTFHCHDEDCQICLRN